MNFKNNFFSYKNVCEWEMNRNNFEKISSIHYSEKGNNLKSVEQIDLGGCTKVSKKSHKIFNSLFFAFFFEANFMFKARMLCEQIQVEITNRTSCLITRKIKKQGDWALRNLF
ncbi:hypothetical protein BpHYR1_012049 [Brachionus plicatilis]|uniref:Uncharacterized protein n=1 Tax=Brachionus plicatilis TaxID=10195 RepID=A0A3M7SW00_BRAPC|nr:hypothetical protein BpHYR1_012049 [Brachionus plicatilis]